MVLTEYGLSELTPHVNAHLKAMVLTEYGLS
jgi:hypothetical protein